MEDVLAPVSTKLEITLVHADLDLHWALMAGHAPVCALGGLLLI